VQGQLVGGHLGWTGCVRKGRAAWGDLNGVEWRMLGRDILPEPRPAVQAHLAVERVAFPSLLVEALRVQGLRVRTLDGRVRFVL